MRCASIKIDPGDSHMRENLKGPGSKDVRLERRWKRRCSSNENLKRNRHASATRITVKSYGNMDVLKDNNGHMAENEVDEDYKMFLDAYVSHIEIDSDNNVDGSYIKVDTCSNSDNDDDSDPQYKMFLENLREEGKSYVFSFFMDNQLVHIRYEGEKEEEEEEESLHDQLQSDKSFTWRDETGNLVSTEGDSMREQTGGPVESQRSLETERGPCNKRPRSDVSCVPNNNCNTESEFDSVDEDYQIFLNSCRIVGDCLVYVGRDEAGNLGTMKEQTGGPVESQQSLETERGPCNKRPHSDVSSVPKNTCNTESEFDSMDEDYQIFLNSCRIDGDRMVYVGRDEIGNLGTTESDSMREQTGGPVESQQILETERRPCNKRPRSDVSSVPKNNCNTELEFDSVDEDYQIFLNSCRIDGDRLVYVGSELKRKKLSVWQNSQVSNQASDTPKVQCDAPKVEGSSNSSDPDLILLEPNQICGNTSFISSKMYDSSWFENEANTRYSRPFSAHDHSQFRKRLMEYLERPYDQEECDVFLREVTCQRQKERHRETRRGVVKLCRVDGVNKSYLEVYPDLAKAIAEFKEPHRVLFLLRGFIYWLQNLTQDGTFRPWLDKSCLEILRKM